MKPETRNPKPERSLQVSTVLLIPSPPSQSPQPSPQLSPLGRGRTASRVGPSRSALNLPNDRREGSLSPREGVGVRGKKASALPGAPCLNSACRTRLSDFLRSEEHTSELQSLRHLVCRLLLEKKKN